MIALLFMLVGGGALAVFVMVMVGVLSREEGAEVHSSGPHRDSVAASLLYHVVSASGVGEQEALREVRRSAGYAAPVTRGIDVTNWAESYARMATPEQRRELLELAVRLVASRSPVPLRQYAALLDLSFGLGFQTDALAKLRELYGFDYIDHAKDARPRGAEHVPLFARSNRSRDELLRILGMEGTSPTRQELSAAYRRLVSAHHPDRYHDDTPEARSEAAARFIEITKAYEELLRGVVEE